MGGLLILFAAAIAVPRRSRSTRVPALTVLFVTLACGAIGFLDDFIKLTHKRSLGLTAAGSCCCSARSRSASAIAAHHQHLATKVYIPVIGAPPALVRRGTCCSSS